MSMSLLYNGRGPETAVLFASDCVHPTDIHRWAWIVVAGYVEAVVSGNLYLVFLMQDV